MTARRSSQPAQKKGIKVTENGRTLTVDLEVISLKGTSGEGPFFLVLFQPVDGLSQAQPPSAAKKSAPSGAKGPPADQNELTRLQRKLTDTNAHLHAVISEQETYAEELQAANEEAQSGNEELQSINEELETSKEELQATNEELGTINAELHARNAELGHANEDLANLLGSVRLPIVMVGIDLRIRRFNVAAGLALHLIPTLAEVIRDMAVRECEVQDRQGRWFILRAHPYRTAENKIEGAILLLIDIDELKRTTESRDYSQAIINTLHEPLVVLRPDLRVNTANRAFYELLDTVPQETE
jgi:two-component system CheB/CheR fusion protein